MKTVGVSKDVVGVDSQADINIFTVASGLLYEVGFIGFPSSFVSWSVFSDSHQL